MRRKFYKLYNMTINLTITPYEYALACLGAAALGKTLDAAIVQAQVSVTVQQCEYGAGVPGGEAFQSKDIKR